MIGVFYLMKFDLSYISSSMVRGTITNPKFYLNLYDANPTNLSWLPIVMGLALSQSWVVGEGFDHDDPITQQQKKLNFKTVPKKRIIGD